MAFLRADHSGGRTVGISFFHEFRSPDRLQRSFSGLSCKINLQSFFEKGKKIRGNSHEFIMKTAPERVGTQYTSSDMVFGIFFFASKSHFSKSEENGGKTRKTQENLRFSDGIYFDP